MSIGKKRKQDQYDYENAFCSYLEELDMAFTEEMIKNKVGLHYATKTIKSGKVFEVEIYPVFKSKADIPKTEAENRAQNDLNEKNSKKRFIRMVNANFGEGDLWITLTYDDNHHPKTKREAKKNIRNYLRRINRIRKKRGLENAKYIYIIEWEENAAEKRCHYHILMEGGIDRNTLEDIWDYAIVNDTSRIHPNEDGITGLAAYMADKKRGRGERRWIPSKNLKQPEETVNHSKTSKSQVERMVRDYEEIRTFFEKEKKWKKYQFVDAEIMYNKFNSAFYIRIRARERSWESEKRRKEGFTGGSSNNMYRDPDYGGVEGHTAGANGGNNRSNSAGRKNSKNNTNKGGS